MPTVAETKERVQAYLTRFGPVSIDSDGDLSLPAGSTRVFVRVREHPNGEATLVDVWAIILRKVEVTPALFEYIATNTDNWVFGHPALFVDDKTNTATVIMTHRLLGDYLDLDELMYVVGGVAGSSDEFDDELQATFGGQKFSDS